MEKTGPDFSAVQEAAAFASRAHRHQLRKDGRTPYVSHVVRVAFTVRHLFGCEDAVALTASLLHDTIEDTTTDYDDLSERFGPAVAECVAALTKNMALPESQRETEYDDRLARADWRARLIKLADVYDNFCDGANGDDGPDDKRVARCKRAIGLAARDRGRPEIDRAVRAVEELLAKGCGRG
jgi:guanosine-3',5'-bis(diphosphate) 3'-pyrophosphohydrolase